MSAPHDPAALRAQDAAHHIHPFTNHLQMHKAGTHILAGAEGCWLRDIEGRKLLDGLAGLWCVNVGYNRPEIIEAVHRQMKQLSYYPSFFNSTTEPSIQLADRMAGLASASGLRLNHTLFSGSGSEAVETAIKITRAYWHLKGKPERNKIFSRQFSYHGMTLAASSLTGLPACHTGFDLPLPGFFHAPAPYPYAAQSKLDAEAYGQWCLQETEKMILKEGPDTVAAFFAEPVQGAGAVIVPPRSYLKGLRELCRKHGILFVADEVITGFGRLGAWFASGLWELDPDMMTLAKGISSGHIPLGATMTSGDLTKVIFEGGMFSHGFTYSGHPVAAAAATANLDIIEKEKLVERVRDDVGPYFQEKLRSFAGHPSVGDVRGTGLIGALELVPKGGRAALKPDAMIGLKAAALLRQEGCVARGIRDSLAMSPPFIIKRDAIDFLFAGVGRVLDKIQQDG